MEALEDLLAEWGFWFLPIQALAVALTALIPPFPSEPVVIASGAYAADGRLSPAAVLGFTTAGCLLGDLALHLLVRFQGLRLIYRWRWGRKLHRGILRASIRAGSASTLVGLLLLRWVPGGRSASMVTAAMIRLHWTRLLPLLVLGALIWSLWLTGLGYITGTTTGMPPWASTVTGIGVGTLVGFLIALVWTRRRRGSTQVRVEPSSAD